MTSRRTALRLWARVVVCILMLAVGLGRSLPVSAGTAHHARTASGTKKPAKHGRNATKKRTQADKPARTSQQRTTTKKSTPPAKRHSAPKRRQTSRRPTAKRPAKPSRASARHGTKKTRRSAKRHPAKRRRHPPRRPLIIIDPGHGGRDPGAIAGRMVEKKLTLRLARQLARELRRRGFRTRLTRTCDVAVPLLTRARCAARQRPDLFVSIHCNCGPSPDQNGLETFAYLPKRARPGHKLQIPIDDAVNVDTTATRVALAAHKAWLRLARRQGWRDGGVRLGRLAVLSVPGYPAVLFELGYLTNRKDARRLRSARARRKLVRALARALAKQFVRGKLRP